MAFRFCFHSLIKLDFFAETGKVIPLLVRSAFNCLTVLFSGNWRSYGTDRDDGATCFVFAFLLVSYMPKTCHLKYTNSLPVVPFLFIIQPRKVSFNAQLPYVNPITTSKNSKIELQLFVVTLP